MKQIILGRTGLSVSADGFGALPIQRISLHDAAFLLHKAYDSGITFFDTARAYSDSEEKVGYALSDVRNHIVIATKTTAQDKKTLTEHLETSLRLLKTDYIDIYQLHNPPTFPHRGDELYEALLKAKEEGKIRFISITSHSMQLAKEAVLSGLYDTLQFPLSILSADSDLELIKLCKQNNIGLIAMKAMAGGLIRNPALAYAFFGRYDNVVPIWGVQRESELDEFLGYSKCPPVFANYDELVAQEKKELSGSFCRGCGYCLPCPAKIDIPTSARMSLLLRRAPYQNFLTDEWREKMSRIENCIHCGHCTSKCPYKLDTPALLRENLSDYKTFCEEHK